MSENWIELEAKHFFPVGKRLPGMLVKVAKLLCEQTGLDRVFFCNSGAEAVEGCIKLARKWGKEKRDGAYEIIVAENAFHGRTLATVTATATEKDRAPFTPLGEGVVRVQFTGAGSIKKDPTQH